MNTKKLMDRAALILALAGIAGIMAVGWSNSHAGTYVSPHRLIGFADIGKGYDSEIVLGIKRSKATGNLRIDGKWLDYKIPPSFALAPFPLRWNAEHEHWDIVGSVVTGTKRKPYIISGRRCMRINDTYQLPTGIIDADRIGKYAWKHGNNAFGAVLQRPDGTTLEKRMNGIGTRYDMTCGPLFCEVYASAWTDLSIKGEYRWLVDGQQYSQCFLVN